MNDEKKLFDQPVKSDVRAYEIIRKVATYQEMITLLVVY